MNPTHVNVKPGEKVELIIVDKTLPVATSTLDTQHYTRVLGLVDGETIVLYSEHDFDPDFLRQKSLTLGKVLGERYGCEVHVLK